MYKRVYAVVRGPGALPHDELEKMLEKGSDHPILELHFTSQIEGELGIMASFETNEDCPIESAALDFVALLGHWQEWFSGPFQELSVYWSEDEVPS